MMQHDLKPRWTDEEISFLKFAYPNKEFTMDEILKAFPNRSYHAIRFQARRLNLKRYSEPDPPKGYKRCSSCDTILPLSWFSKNKTKKYGKHARCKVCDARCFEKSISQLVYDTSFFTAQPKKRASIICKPFQKSEWDYKKSPFQTTNSDEAKKIICSATFVLEQKDDKEHTSIESKCKHFINERIEKGHFKFPSAGSVFKNNHNFGKPSGALIDQAGLKGVKIGGAQIAPFHGNFIINVDHAKSDDIKELVELTKKTIKEKFGFDLENEIIFLTNQ